MRLLCAAMLLAAGQAALGQGPDKRTPTTRPSLRAEWALPASCDPFAPPRVKDLKEELRQTGYRLVIAIHPDKPPNPKGEYLARDLYLINADGTGLRQLCDTPDQEEHAPRVSPDGRRFTYNYGDFVMDAKTFKFRPSSGGYVWTPDGKQTVTCEKRGLVYTDVDTGKAAPPVKVTRRASIVDLSPDGRWFIFEMRDYLGQKYTIDIMPSDGNEVRKLPNHPLKTGECHPAFSPDGRWMCWNAGDSLAVRRFDPSLPDATDGNVVTLPKDKLGQDPCGRWSHCGRYIAFVKIPHTGSWKVHSPLCIVRVADGETITLSPPGWVGHHWDYDWLPPAEPAATEPAK